MTENAIILVAFLSVSLAVLVGLAGGLALLERIVPGFSEWLDGKIGQPEEWRRW